MTKYISIFLTIIALIGCIRVTEGEEVDVVGVVTDDKCPLINGYMCWELDAYRGKKVRLKGRYSTYLVTDEMIVESAKTGVSYKDAREIKEIFKILEVSIVE